VNKDRDLPEKWYNIKSISMPPAVGNVVEVFTSLNEPGYIL